MQRLFKTVKGSITVLVTLILVPTIFLPGLWSILQELNYMEIRL